MNQLLVGSLLAAPALLVAVRAAHHQIEHGRFYEPPRRPAQARPGWEPIDISQITPWHQLPATIRRTKHAPEPGVLRWHSRQPGEVHADHLDLRAEPSAEHLADCWHCQTRLHLTVTAQPPARERAALATA